MVGLKKDLKVLTSELVDNLQSNLPSLMKVLTGSLTINKISIAFYSFEFLFTSTANNDGQNVYLNIALK